MSKIEVQKKEKWTGKKSAYGFPLVKSWRMFGDDSYRLTETHTTKREANRRARKFRKAEITEHKSADFRYRHKARVLKTSGGWTIYTKRLRKGRVKHH